MIPREQLLQVRRIASRANPRVKEWASLVDKSARTSLNLTLAEGSKLVREALTSAADSSIAPLYQPKTLLVSDAGTDHPDAGELFRLAGELGIERYSLSDDSFAKISSLKGADGLALALTPTADSLPQPFRSGSGKWLAAVGVQDPGNAGALSRIALAADFAGCILVEGVDPHSPKFLRGSMGAAFRLPCPLLSADEFIALADAGAPQLIAATSAADALDYRRMAYPESFTIVIGGESGIPDSILAACGAKIHIPLH
ncbi:MAG: hypothetical protein LIP23_05620, partial [Planctomycetes bacterium]|nr:hypothetical protein [Planctomycetota bacterium]